MLSAVGKKSNNGECLPVITHLNDCAFVAEFLFDSWLCESIKTKISSIKKIREKFIFTCLVHDIGKFHPDFQKLILENKKHGKRHDVLSRAYICKYLNIDYQCEQTPSIIEIIGYHHGRLHDRFGSEQEDYDTELMQKENTKITLFSLIDSFLEDLNLTKNDISETWDTYTNFIMSGMLIIADWIASNSDIFPYTELDNTKQRYLLAEEKLKNLIPEIQYKTFNDAESFFTEAFHFSQPNELQEISFNITNKNNDNQIFIIEAPTGCGKTEASLAIAYSLIKKKGLRGIYMALPTCATSNALYNRFSDFVKNIFGQNNNVILEHSKAKIFLDDNDINYENIANKKLTGINNFIIGTTDHVIRLPIYTKHLTMFHAELANKVIIFDEVHSYDPIMFEYLIKTLKFLKAYNTPVIILSATLPENQKTQILKVYSKNTINFENNNDIKAFPAITTISNNMLVVERITQQHKKLPDIQLLQQTLNDSKDNSIDANSIKNIIKQNGLKGYYGIIVNTVERSQDIYKELIPYFGKENVILLHSRFESSHRSTIENNIISSLGKHCDNKDRYKDKQFLIIIGTQILEQSIDIDFDCMFTDLCPADCLVQRMGRLHRHQNNNDYRPHTLYVPQCFILQAYIDDNLNKCIHAVSKLIYSDYRLMITYSNLLNMINITHINKNESIKNDYLQYFIQNSYNDEDEYTLYGKSLNDYRDSYKNTVKKDRAKAKRNMLDSRCSCNDISTVHLYNQTDDINYRDINPCVRKSMNSLEVILLNYHSNTNKICFCYSNNEINNKTSEITLLKHTIALPSSLVNDKNSIDQIINALSKQQNEISQKASLVLNDMDIPYLILTDNKRILTVNNKSYIISYDEEIGLIIDTLS